LERRCADRVVAQRFFQFAGPANFGPVQVPVSSEHSSARPSNDRIDSEKLAHLLRSNLIPPAYVYPAAKRPLRALLRQRIFYVWRRSELLHRIHSHQLAHNRTPAKQTRRCRDDWEEQLLKAENHPLRQLALKNDVAMIRHFDEQIFALEEELNRQTKRVACREYTLLKTLPGVGESLVLTILYEIGDRDRFPSVKDFLSYCRLVKGTVASAGKIKGLRGAKLGNPCLRWASGEAAVIAKRDHYRLKPLAQRLEAKMNGNKFNAEVSDGGGHQVSEFAEHHRPPPFAPPKSWRGKQRARLSHPPFLAAEPGALPTSHSC